MHFHIVSAEIGHVASNGRIQGGGGKGLKGYDPGGARWGSKVFSCVY